jgi:hypothetical protein
LERLVITLDEFLAIKAALASHPEPLNGMPLADHIEWSETAGPPMSPEDFALEAIYVICNSGMKHTIARQIYERCRAALLDGQTTSTETRALIGLPKVFGHAGKTSAIDTIWFFRDRLYAEYMAAGDKVEFCGALPWIGGITKYHLAKNFGADVAKPDVHLERLAKHHGTTPQALCDELAAATGYKSRTIDLILWMACAKGVIRVPA